jgi:hypothetical protein
VVPVPDPLIFFLVVPGIEPGTPDLIQLPLKFIFLFKIIKFFFGGGVKSLYS